MSISAEREEDTSLNEKVRLIDVHDKVSSIVKKKAKNFKGGQLCLHLNA